MQDLISVVVPIYKVEKYLAKCIDSILSQTYRNLEIILVDDGSPDNCPQICDEYEKKDNRIKVIHQKNSGLSEARNAGIRVASGKYIGFVDSDDYIAEDMYEKLFLAMKKENADLAICNVQMVDEEGRILPEETNIENHVYNRLQMLGELAKDTSVYYITAWNKLYRREIFEQILFPYGKTHEDEFVVHEVFYACQKVTVISDILYFYVQRGNSIMSSKMSVKRLDKLEALYNRVLFYEQHDELKDYIFDVSKKLCLSYIEIASRIVVNNNDERMRMKNARALSKEIYNSRLKQDASWKQKLKYSMPEVFILFEKIRATIEEFV